MTQRYFGTDGIRGHVGRAPMTPEFILKLAQAAGHFFRTQHAQMGLEGNPTVLIGKDTRLSGYMFEATLEAGFSAAGVDTLLAGPIPTPAVAYLVRTLHLSAGVVISASHNPYTDNGIKFFDRNGYKLADSAELAIEAAIEQPHADVLAERIGRAQRVADAAGRYIEFCKQTFPRQQSLDRLHIVLDCAHGAAYQIAPKVFRELGAKVTSIGCTPDGLNINHQVGATHAQHMIDALHNSTAQIGIALDGDADRLLLVEKNGNQTQVFDGDCLLYAIVKHRLSMGEKIDTVVGTLMSNLALELGLKQLGVKLLRAKVGDRYVLQMMQEKGAYYGAENSGHILCLRHHSTGDGIIAALQVLAALVQQPQPSLRQFISELQLFPQVLINVRLPSNTQAADVLQQAPLKAAVIASEAALAGQGRVLLRPSGTEPLVRVMVEARDPALAQKEAQKLADCVQQLISSTDSLL